MKTLKGYAYDARTVEALQAVDEPGVYQFFGMRGIGKRTAAEIVAEKMLGSRLSANPDYLMISPKEKNKVIGIDDIEDLFVFTGQMAANASYKVCVIDDADLLTESAQNALLKLLEEQAGQVVIILVAHRHLIDTVESRAKLIPFYSLQREEMKEVIDDLDPLVAELSGGRIGFYKSMVASNGYVKTVKNALKFIENGNKADLFDCLHVIREKDKASFYETYDLPLIRAFVAFLRQVFYKILLGASGIEFGFTPGIDVSKASEHYSILSIQAAVSVLSNAERMISDGRFNKNDWFDMLRFIAE